MFFLCSSRIPAFQAHFLLLLLIVLASGGGGGWGLGGMGREFEGKFLDLDIESVMTYVEH